MQAILLCGGLGTRLREVVKDVPKPMAPINGTPFMQIKLDQLVDAGVSRVVFATGYKKEIIRDYFGDNYRGMEICYSEENEPLGTGGAIKQALEYITEANVIVMNGDAYIDIDLKALMQHHLDNPCTATIAVKPMHNFDRYGNCIFDGILIKEFIEKQPTHFGHINLGCYVLSRNIFDGLGLDKKFSFENDYLNIYVKTKPHHVYINDGYFIDIGIPSDYFSFIDYMSNKK